MPKYVNPIPAIDMGKTFEMRLSMHFDDLLPVDDAKKRVAAYIKEQPVETIAEWLHCTSIKALYPDDLTPEQKAMLEAGPGPGKEGRT